MPDIIIKKITYADDSEWFVTGRAAEHDGSTLRTALTALKRNGMSVVKIIFVGDGHAYAKNRKLLERYPSIAVKNCSSFVQVPKNYPKNGFIIHAVSGNNSAKDILLAGKKIGLSYRLGGGEFVCVCGLDKAVKKDGKFELQTKENYALISSLMKKNLIHLSDVYRFWNLIYDIKKNYGPFNKVRDHFFGRCSLDSYPAATGIEADFWEGRKISIFFEALRHKGKSQVRIKRIRSGMQCEAKKYGPKFSRAVMMAFGSKKVKKIFVSGTSNVDKNGNSVFLDDPAGNVSYVMECVGHLLGKERMALDDIASSIVYFKNARMQKEFLSLYKKERWKFPFIPVFTNICRETFFFEIECVASNRTGSMDISQLKSKI